MTETMIDDPSDLPYYLAFLLGLWVPYALVVLLVWAIHSGL